MSKERTEKQIIADIRKELLGLEQLAMTPRQLQSAVWKLWGFVRENQNSLDSERCCRQIQEIVSGAVSAVDKRAATLAAELDTAEQELKDSKKEVKRLTKELEKSCEEAVNLGLAASKAQDDIERLQAMLAEKKTQDTEIQSPNAA